jgi:hypothetical protein
VTTPYSPELEDLIRQADELTQRMTDDGHVPLVVIAHLVKAGAQLRLALYPEESDLL